MKDSTTPTWRNAVYDWGAAVAVAIVSMTGLGLEHPWAGTDFELVATGLATAVPLGWRRVRSIPVGIVIGLTLIVQTHVLGESLHFGSFCAVITAMFSIARHTPARVTAGLGGAALAGSVLFAQVDELAAAPAEILFPVFYFTGTWLIGRGMRALHEQADRLRQLNIALERDRESRAELAVTQERLALARELHDLVGHTVMLMVVQAAAADETLASDPVATRKSLAAVQDAGRRGMEDLRSLVDVLRGGSTVDVPADDAIRAMARRMEDAGRLVHLIRNGDLGKAAPEVVATVLRVLRESLTNVLRHSEAARIEVRLDVDADNVHLRVEDNGPRRSATAGGCHGIQGMQERARLLDGHLEAGPHGDGFRVHATLPVRSAK